MSHLPRLLLTCLRKIRTSRTRTSSLWSIHPAFLLAVAISAVSLWSVTLAQTGNAPATKPSSPPAKKATPGKNAATQNTAAPDTRAAPKAAPDDPNASPADDTFVPMPVDEETEPIPFEMLPIYNEKPLPSYERLLKGPPVDWIVFVREDRVIEVSPITPRPNALQALKDKLDEANRKALPMGAEREAEIARRKDLPNIVLTLLENDQEKGSYRMHMRHAHYIIHYEDLILRRVDALLDEKLTPQAFELLRVVQQRDPNWPGLTPRRERLQFVEALLFVDRKQPETAWNYLLQLHAKNPQFEGLDLQLGRVADSLMQQARQDQDFRRVRHFLARLRAANPNHDVARRWATELDQQARQQIQAAEAADQSQNWSQAVQLLERAAAIWPDTVPLSEAAKKIWPRHQRLYVGVLDLAGQTQPAPGAILRERELLRRTLFEPTGLDVRGVRYASHFIEEWEPTDLGRSILFRLQARQKLGEPVLASQVTVEIARRLDPAQPEYDERFAGYVSGVRVQGPYEFRVDFRRAPLRPETILQFAIPTAQTESAGEVRLMRQPFFRESATPQQVVYRRLAPQPPALQDWAVTEIFERRYESNEELKRGWQRGEISCIPRIALWDEPLLKRLPESVLLEYALPVSHYLQFHPRHPALKLAAFRKALAYSLNRASVLNEIVLRQPDPSRGRLVSAPFATTHTGYSPLVPPQKYDPRLATAMMLAAKKDLGSDLPKLRLGIPDNPLEKSVGEELCRQWQQLGLEVTLVTVGSQIPFDIDADPAPWDILYRSERMIEPLTDLWPALTLDHQARIERLNLLPDWLRTRLIALDQAGDWPAADALMRQIHRDLAADVTLIPLWEVSEYFLVRLNVRGIPSRPMFPYHDAERWQVQPWFPKDPL